MSKENNTKFIVMTNFKLKGSDLFDNHGHKIASIKGNDIYNEHGHKIAVMKGNDIYNEHGHKIAVMKGNDIYDEHGHKIETISNIKKQIDSALGGTSLAALWICFVR